MKFEKWADTELKQVTRKESGCHLEKKEKSWEFNRYIDTAHENMCPSPLSTSDEALNTLATFSRRKLEEVQNNEEAKTANEKL